MTSQKLCLALPLVALSALAASQIPHFRVTDLGTLGGATSYASANRSGQVAGFSAYNAYGAMHAYWFAAGSMVDLGTLGGSTSYAYGINGAGEVIGTAYGPDDATADAFVWSNGTMSNIGTLGGSFSDAYGINDSGVVVGDAAIFGDFAVHAFVYAGSLTDIGTLGGVSSSANGINGVGAVVGSSDTTTVGTTHAFEYSQGTMLDLGTLGGDFSSASAINSAGLVVGGSNLAVAGTSHAFLFDGVSMADLGTLGGDYSYADSINSSGQVVGVAATSTGLAFDGFLFTGGVMYDLNSLVDSSGTGIAVGEAYGIDDEGAIAADATMADGSTHAVLLSPYFVETPTSYSIFRGALESGDLSSLQNIDGQYLTVLTGPTLSGGEAPVSVVLTTRSDAAVPSSLQVAVTSHARTVGLTQTIELWDYVAGAWVSVASGAATTTDKTVTAGGSSPARFVQAGSNMMQARVSWRQTGLTTISRWSTSIDQVAWTVAP